MKRSLLALSLAVALGAVPAVYAQTSPNTDATNTIANGDSGGADPGGTQTTPAKVKQLGTVDVSAALDQSRNALSPDTGSSQYVFDQKAIQQLPLGDATPLNQVLLQAPGVVQDSYGELHVRGDHANLQYRINGVIIPEAISGFGQIARTRAPSRASSCSTARCRRSTASAPPPWSTSRPRAARAGQRRQRRRHRRLVRHA